MIALLALIFLMISSFGLGIIIFTKVPALVKLPDSYCGEDKVKRAFAMIKSSFDVSKVFGGFSLEKLFQKILSKTRVFVLRLEGKLSVKLGDLRKKSQEKTKTDKDYWKKIKNITRKKD